MYNKEAVRTRIESIRKMSRKNCENKTFKLVGVFNYFGVFPAFVAPVFICEQDEKDGKIYMQECDEGTLKLNSFYDMEPYKDVNREKVISIEKINKNEFKDSFFTLDSKTVCAFQISENDYFLGYPEDMKKFLKDFSTTDETVKEDIESFMKQCD